MKANHTNYIHSWKKAPFLAPFAMASIDPTMGENARAEAKALGFRTFRIIDNIDQLQDGEMLCPATKNKDKELKVGELPVTCNTCTLCDGKQGENDKRKDIAEIEH
tara:strand:- start:8165 stop:8482 length:318 start_codon:yes stop_codon:yes gene_type:complete